MINSNSHLRLRVFAGPNGSGKSTVIKSVKNYKLDDGHIDFGIYVNADDIAKQLRENTFSFNDYDLEVSPDEFTKIASGSGLIGGGFDNTTFTNSFIFQNNKILLATNSFDEYLAQIIADFLRRKLLTGNRKFSFETVFSHSSKIDIMREAAENGYKVYLYFVSTESPEINKYRVQERTAKGGHNVPTDKIESRYYRSLDLLYDAAQIAYQEFFWDNSVDGNAANMFAHFKKTGNKKTWDKINEADVPNWFKKYYMAKVKQA